MHKKRNKKILALLLCVCMLISALPISAWATSDTIEDGGAIETIVVTTPEETEPVESGEPTEETGPVICDVCGAADCTAEHLWCDFCDCYDCGIDHSCTCGTKPHTQDCPAYVAPTFFEILMASRSVSELYRLLSSAVESSSEDAASLSAQQLIALQAYALVLDPQGMDINSVALKDLLYMLLNNTCPDCGLSGEHAEDCPRAAAQPQAITWTDLGSSFTGGTLTSGYYILNQNYLLENTILIPAGETVTINLNHRMLQGNGTDPVIYVEATGTVNDVGSIVSDLVSGSLTIIDESTYKNTVTGYLDTDGLWRRDAHLLGGKESASSLEKKVVETGLIYNMGSGQGIMCRGTLSMTGGLIMGCKSGTTDTGAAICGTSTAQITLNSVTVQYNQTTRVYSDEAGTQISWGGVVHCEKDYHDLNAHLTATNCIIQHNQSVSKGGGVSGGKITLTGCTITDNTAAFGGGVEASQSLTVSDCTISNNTATNDGGGIYCEAVASHVQISGSTISNNVATDGDGGGIFTAGSLTITGGTLIDGNTATNGCGGGFYSRGTTVTDSTVSNNKATGTSIGKGGGIYVLGALTVNGTSKIYKNSADYWGGGIYTVGQGYNHYFTDSANVQENEAADNGGGIYCNGILNLQGSAIFQGNVSGISGGAAYAAYINMSSANVQILNNTAKNYGGGLAGTFEIIITAGTIKGNKAAGGAGVMRIGVDQGTTSAISGCVIEDNAASANGGGVYIGIYEMTIGDAIIRNNTAGDNGGGVFVNIHTQSNTPGSVILDGTTITGNTADDFGGGVWAAATSQVTAKNGTTIDSNSASLGNGGGIYATLISITGSTVSNNKAAADQPNSATIGRGGGIGARDGSEITVTDSTITGNQAAVQGGGIWVGLNSTVTIDNSTVSKNKTLTTALTTTTTEGSGGGIYAKGVLTVTNGSVISGNEAAWCGGGIFGTESAVVLIEKQSSLTGNTSVNNGGATYILGTTTVTTGASVTDNSAHAGGGLYAGTLVITGTEDSMIRVAENTAETFGGGIVCTVSASIDYALVQDNIATAQNAGGLICTENCITGTITNSEFRGNVAKTNGGGIDILGTATVSDCYVVGNRAGVFGGGVMVTTGGTLTMTDTVIENNDAIELLTTALVKGNSGRGGGVCVVGTATFENVTLTGNRTLRYGGGLHVYDGGVAYWISGTITKNVSLLDGAGGIYVENAELTIDKADITYNEADEVGGGIHINKATLIIHAANITNNTVYAGGGGGIHANLGSTLTIHDGIVIKNNQALCGNRVTSVTMASNAPGAAATVVRGGAAGTGNGGGLCAAGATVYMNGGIISDNFACGNGGGVAIRDLTYQDIFYPTVFYMISGSICDNEAGQVGGGVYVNGAAQANAIIGVENCDGTGSYHTVEPTEKTHPIISGNEAGTNGGGIGLEGVATVTVYCGSITNNTAEPNRGRGHNAYVDGTAAALTVVNAEMGADEAPELVIVGGSLTTDSTADYVTLYYYQTNDAATPDKQAAASQGSYFHLPDARQFWSVDGKIFMGWTFNGAADADLAYVRDSDDYQAVGSPVQAVDTVDGSAGDMAVHMYALWISETSSITYSGCYVDGVYRSEALATNPNNPTAYTFSQAANNVLLEEPAKNGYTFTGWYVYQNDGQNANWGIEPGNPMFLDKDTPLDLGSSHFGDITVIPVYTENTVTYIHYIVGPQGVTGFGSIYQDTNVKADGYSYTIKADSGAPQTITAKAAYRYQFLGWYADADCTQLVTMDADLPVEKTDGVYTGGTFYALFDYYLDDLTITCTATGYFSSQQSFIYEVWCEDQLVTTVTLKSGESVTVRNLFIGKEYTVKEVSGWSWRFLSQITGGIQKVTLTVGGNTVSFTANQYRHLWLTHDTFERTGNG